MCYVADLTFDLFNCNHPCSITITPIVHLQIKWLKMRTLFVALRTLIILHIGAVTLFMMDEPTNLDKLKKQRAVQRRMNTKTQHSVSHLMNDEGLSAKDIAKLKRCSCGD